MKDNITDLIIIGGGPAGMLAAVMAGRAGLSVLVLEHNDSYGKKLSVTGNGKCNYTNLYQSIECYRGSDTEASFKIIQKFGPDKIIDFMRSLGIEPYKRCGREFDDARKVYVYPASESAADFTEAFQVEMNALKVKQKTRLHVCGIEKKEGCFNVTTIPSGEEDMTNAFSYKSRFVLVSAGGLAAPETGSDGSMLKIVKNSGIKVSKMTSALTKIYTKENLQNLAGVRMTGKISLMHEERVYTKEVGEIQFGTKAVSGIPAMQLSSLINDRNDLLLLDFFPNMSDNETMTYLEERRRRLKWHPAASFLKGLFPPKFGAYILEKLALKKSLTVDELKIEDLSKIKDLTKYMLLHIDKKGDFGEAQVTHGGILLSECTKNLEAKNVSGLYFAGEILDTDGICGGYNLTWAFASAYTAIQEIINKLHE